MVLFSILGYERNFFQKLVKFTLETKKNQIFYQFFCQCVNHNGYLEKGN